MTRARASVLAFIAFAAAWCLAFAYLATIEPIRHDGWWHLLAHARGQTLVGFVGDAYVHGNPRLGQWLTFVAFGATAWHALLAAAGAGALVAGAFVLAFARAPRPRDLADTVRLIAIAALVFACTPNPGQMLCYRPFTGNYVWAWCVTMAFAAPYRMISAAARGASPGPRGSASRSPRGSASGLGPAPLRGGISLGALAAIGMLVLGVAAGMANEHTGPTAIAFAALAIVLAHRRGDVRPWMLAGLIGVAAGVALLLAAPGQSERYHGLGAETSLVGNVLDRGVVGNLRLVGMACLYTIGSWLAIAIAVVKTRRAPREVAGLVLAALAIIATVLVSPKQGPRLFFAPAILLIAAAVRALDDAFTCRILRAILGGAAAIVAVLGVAQLVRVERGARDDFDARVALLRGGATRVPPYARFVPDWWGFGDDFRSAPLREHVARRVFGLDDVTLDTTDPHVLARAGVSLALSIDPPDPALVRAADPDRLGFSEQLFTRDGATAADDLFTAAIANVRGRATRAELRIAGLTWPQVPPLVYASFDDTGLHLPLADRAPAGALILRAGGEVTRVTADTPIDRALADLPPGGYLVAACAPDLCHVLATRRR